LIFGKIDTAETTCR